jgi:hypothetical protein
MFVRSPKFWSVILASVLALVGHSADLQAGSVVDLTVSGASGTLNDGVFIQGSTGSGTGRFPAFAQIGGAGQATVRDGYNTTASVLFNGSSAEFNHEIQVSQLTLFNYNGSDYYSFRLDVNETSGQGDQFISLNQLKLYTSDTANQSLTNPDLLGTLRYDMQGDGPGNVVLLDYELGTGSGTGDMLFLVPVSNFAGAAPDDFVYLYSQFGLTGVVGDRNYGTSDGFEEWALGPAVPEVPEPSSMLLLAIGAFGMGGYGLKKWRKSAAPVAV